MEKYKIKYSIGDFAKLCNTTIPTLLHYEHIGLLLPCEVNSKGWRFYLYVQYFTYHTICVLKQSGCSLDEIRNYLEDSDLEHNLMILNHRRLCLEEEIRRLKRANMSIVHSMKGLKRALSAPMDTIRHIQLPEEHLIVEQLNQVGPVFQGKSPNVKLIRDRLLAYNELCEGQECVEGILPCLLFLKEDVMRNNLDNCFCFRTLYNKIQSPQLREKSAGDYLSLIKEGFWPESFQETISLIWSYMNHKNMNLAGDVYIYPLKTNKTGSDRFQIVYEVQIPIHGKTPPTGPTS